MPNTMSLEQQIADLTAATTNLLDAVNVRKSALDAAFAVSVWAVLRWVRRTLAKSSGFKDQISEHKGGARPESCEGVRPTGDDNSRGSAGS